jgi:hypothetical protein
MISLIPRIVIAIELGFGNKDRLYHCCSGISIDIPNWYSFKRDKSGINKDLMDLTDPSGS